ncbi:hypothetical protein [Lunatimonas salinarum]|uniref:hypothetical protein n=1 Tax=Lunatimonas salinarum TaxID=1774590 RepID=UPI001ADF3D6D|nr:hypothetical protein [Lunatimonas salinarum]
MQRGNRFSGLGTVLGCMLIVACGCGRSESEKQADVPEVDELVERQQLLEIGVGMLSEWITHWGSQGFVGDAASFTKVQTIALDHLERPEVNPLAGTESNLESFQLSNPEGFGVIDIYDYKVRIDDGGEVLYEPDAEVTYYKANGMRERLLFIGPSGLFEDAVWINGQTLLVAGYFEGDQGFSPMLWLVSIDKGSYEVYESSFVAPSYARHAYLEEKFKVKRE